jgi:hypothetical protein
VLGVDATTDGDGTNAKRPKRCFVISEFGKTEETRRELGIDAMRPAQRAP